MSNIIPFESASLPAYLKNVNVAAINNDLLGHASTGFPIISIKGKQFAISRDGERTVIMNPKDPESAATSVEMVLVKASKNVAKVFYAKGYTEGSEAVKPDCSSVDGIRPDERVENPVSASCKTCPKNAWGSKITEAGKKIKACTDSVRIAVATLDALDDPYMIRVPPASIRNLGEYGKLLAKKGVAYDMVVTKISFNPEAATPELTFKPVGFIPEAQYAQVKDTAASDVTQNILGSVFAAHAAADTDIPEEFEQSAPVIEKAKEAAKAPPKATKAKEVKEEEVEAAVEAAEKQIKKAAAPTPEPVTAATDIGDLDFDDISFDD